MERLVPRPSQLNLSHTLVAYRCGQARALASPLLGYSGTLLDSILVDDFLGFGGPLLQRPCCRAPRGDLKHIDRSLAH